MPLSPEGGHAAPRPDAVLSLAVVGEDPLARSGLVAMLGSLPGLVVAVQLDAADVTLSAELLAVQVVVWDLGLESGRDPEGPPAIGALGLPVLALCAREEQAAAALAAGARGVLFRDGEGDQLLAAVRGVAAGLVVLDAAVASSELRLRPLGSAELIEPLTPREREVLDLLSHGLSNHVIAQRLGVSDHTAKFHVNSILAKLGVQSRTEAVVVASRLGLVVI